MEAPHAKSSTAMLMLDISRRAALTDRRNEELEWRLEERARDLQLALDGSHLLAEQLKDAVSKLCDAKLQAERQAVEAARREAALDAQVATLTHRLAEKEELEADFRALAAEAEQMAVECMAAAAAADERAATSALRLRVELAQAEERIGAAQRAQRDADLRAQLCEAQLAASESDCASLRSEASAAAAAAAEKLWVADKGRAAAEVEAASLAAQLWAERAVSAQLRAGLAAAAPPWEPPPAAAAVVRLAPPPAKPAPAAAAAKPVPSRAERIMEASARRPAAAAAAEEEGLTSMAVHFLVQGALSAVRRRCAEGRLGAIEAALNALEGGEASSEEDEPPPPPPPPPPPSSTGADGSEGGLQGLAVRLMVARAVAEVRARRAEEALSEIEEAFREQDVDVESLLLAAGSS